MATKTDEEKYTDPALRERLKDEIIAGDRGGKPGQWSARKAQLLAHEYEKAGGGYKGERDETQEHLHEWTEEEWTTRDGEKAEHEDGTVSRYLPKEAWEKLTPEEQEATDKAKIEGSKRGEQFVPNTDAARHAREEVQEAHGDAAKKG